MSVQNGAPERRCFSTFGLCTCCSLQLTLPSAGSLACRAWGNVSSCSREDCLPQIYFRPPSTPFSQEASSCELPYSNSYCLYLFFCLPSDPKPHRQRPSNPGPLLTPLWESLLKE